MAGRKSDFTLTKLDDLFSTQEQRDEATGAAVSSQPAQTEGLAASGADLQGDLVVSAADTAGLALEVRHEANLRLCLRR